MRRHLVSGLPWAFTLVLKLRLAYYVPSDGIPELNFDVGESYAGQIPVDLKKNGAKDPKFFYWFFPTVNPAGKDDVVIWFNGGPGCSSLEGICSSLDCATAEY